MIVRRTFLSGTALVAAGLVLNPKLARASSPAAPRLTATIGGRRVDRDEVLQWEARRLKVAAARIKGNVTGWLLGDLDALILRPALSTADVPRAREQLADVKMRLGEAEMRKLTTVDLDASNPLGVITAAPHQWAISHTTIQSDAGTADGFVNWFNHRIALNDVRSMLVACPDHYISRTTGPKRVEVIEETGGAIVASRFFINLAETDSLPIPVDPKYPARTAGWARNAHGTRIGAVRHQFRNDPDGGFTGELAVAFPAFVPPTFITEHRWHMACEFSNWITAYVTPSRHA